MTDPDTLFPGDLRKLDDAFARAIAEAGGAEEQFARTQVAYRLKRQFAWLTPVTRSRCLMTLDLYEPHEAAIVDAVISVRDDKSTHQITVASAETIATVDDRGWFRAARDWSDKVGPAAGDRRGH